MVAIYCAGSLGREIAGMIQKEQKEDIVFIDDVIEQQSVIGYKKYSYNEFVDLYKPQQIEVIIATGEPYYRKILSNKIIEDGYSLRTFASRFSYISENVRIGQGCVVFPNTYISYGVELEDNVVIHANAQVEASFIGRDSFISLGVFLGEDVKVMNTSFIGPQAVVRDHLTIENNCIIGMNCVLLSGTKEGEVWVGNPARFLRMNEDHRVFKKME